MKLVLLPGLDGTGVLFRPLLRALPANIEPIVVAYPTQEPLGYDQLLPLVAKALPSKEDYLLLGESFGGPLSIRIASSHPPGLRGLILSGSFVTCPFAFVPTWAAVLVGSAPFHLFPWAIKAQAMLGMYESLEHKTLADEAISQVSPRVFAYRVREIMRADAGAELASCNVPLLYMQGTRDRIVVAANLQRIRTIQPNIQCATFDTGHMILKTRPVESARVIAEFAANCASAPSPVN